MSGKSRQTLIKVAVGVLAVVAPVGLLLWFYPESRIAGADVLFYLVAVVIWWEIAISRRRLTGAAVGVVTAVLVTMVFSVASPELAMFLLASTLAGWFRWRITGPEAAA